MTSNKEMGEINKAFEGVTEEGTKETETKVEFSNCVIVDEKETQKPEEEHEREKWSNPIEFLLSCVALSVGLGNVWRFPTTALENGGGAFLIPYLIILVLIGRPLYYMELVLGQFSSHGCVKIWNMAYGLKGIGIGQIFINSVILSYYVSIMAITMHYFFASFSKTLPWKFCPNDSYTECFDSNTNLSAVNISEMMSSSEYYFANNVVKKHPRGLDDGIQPPEWKLLCCLLASWLLLFVILIKGVKSSGKAAYFTALFPYVALIILLVRGLTLPGAMNGILFFITPQFDKLLEPKVWAAAVGQCFFSLSVGYGAIIMMGSYNPFKHNVHRDALIISFTDTFTSLLSGCTTFAIMGYLAEEMKVGDIKDVIKGGESVLAFISYPNVLSRFPWVPQLFSTVFFLMLLSLGVGSATGLTLATFSVVSDAFPSVRKRRIIIVLCIIGFLSGVPFITPQGTYILTLVDYYVGVWGILTVTIFEVIGVQWIYGISNFIRDIYFMLGIKTGYYWKLCWGIISPVALSAIVIFNALEKTELTDGSYVFRKEAHVYGALLTGIGIGMAPLYFLFSLIKRRKKTRSFRLAVKDILLPSHEWGPKNPYFKRSYNEMLLDAKDLRGKMKSKDKGPVRATSFKLGGHVQDFQSKDNEDDRL